MVLTFPVGTLSSQAPVVPRGILRGVVLDPQGKPAAGVFVQLMADSIGEMKPPATRPPRMSYVIDYKSTGPDGRFSFSMPAARRHSLIANGVLTEGKAESLFVDTGDTLAMELRLRVRAHETTPESLRDARLVKLAQQRIVWNARGPARYRITVEFACFCIGMGDGPKALEFRNDSLVASFDKSGMREESMNPFWKDFSVSALFAEAERTIRDPERLLTEIVYNVDYGFPSVLGSDTAFSTTDGLYTVRVVRFRPIP